MGAAPLERTQFTAEAAGMHLAALGAAGAGKGRREATALQPDTRALLSGDNLEPREKLHHRYPRDDTNPSSLFHSSNFALRGLHVTAVTKNRPDTSELLFQHHSASAARKMQHASRCSTLLLQTGGPCSV